MIETTTCSTSCCGRLASAKSLMLSVAVVALASFANPTLANGQSDRDQSQGPLPSISDKTEGMERIEGFFPLYWDAEAGQLWMEINRLNTEVLNITGTAAGLGSNDIGIDRGQLTGSRIVKFERVGRKILMVQPNYEFRSSSDSPEEVRAVTDAFARSVLWGFTAAAEEDGAVLVDMNEFLLRDATNFAQRLRPGTYR
ncbi:MAG: DUF5117 domain-containing protein, partial [Gemmatimonadales bacterium]